MPKSVLNPPNEIASSVEVPTSSTMSDAQAPLASRGSKRKEIETCVRDARGIGMAM
jgi:hypothetical protein